LSSLDNGAVQGHKKIAEQAHRMAGGSADPGAAPGAQDTNAPTEEYRIIQDNPVEAGSRPAETMTFSINATTQLGVKADDDENPFALSPRSSAADVSAAAARKDGIAQTPAHAQTTLTDANKMLHHATQSMFSLRTNKSMRLQKYGAWIAYHDTQSDSIFWYNHETAQVHQARTMQATYPVF
jgi:hypothetical protein